MVTLCKTPDRRTAADPMYASCIPILGRFQHHSRDILSSAKLEKVGVSQEVYWEPQERGCGKQVHCNDHECSGVLKGVADGLPKSLQHQSENIGPERWLF